MKIYLAGPMRGIPEWNFPAFHEAEERLRQLGHVVFSPARLDTALGYSSGTHTGYDTDHIRHVMTLDLACIFAADAIALLPGWEGSTGVTVELALAQFLSLPIYDTVTMKPMIISIRPWSL